METPFLSFSNPNYQFKDQLTKVNQDLDSIDSLDINIMSLADEKQEQSKLLNNEDLNSHIAADDNSLLKRGEVVSDEENDVVGESTDLLNTTGDNDEDEKLDNTDCINIAYGEKPKGILAYISLLEQSARERSERRKRELENSELGGNMDDCDSGQTTPSVSDKLREKT